MPSRLEEYVLINGDEITESPVGRIRFQISGPYISFDDIFPERIILNENGSASPGETSFECTLGMCADYWVEGSIKAVDGIPMLYLKIRRIE